MSGTWPPPTPQLNGHVERNNGAWRYEATLPNDDLEDRWAFADEAFRPHHALDGQTLVEYPLTAKEASAVLNRLQFQSVSSRVRLSAVH